MVYYTYNMFNMFRTLLCPSSGTRDCMCYYSLWCAVLGCWLSGIRCRAAGCESRNRDVARLRRATFCRACNTHRVIQKNANFWNA